MSFRGFFSDRDFWKATLRLGLPIALQNLLMSSGTLVDTVMVGQLGETSLAAVGMAGQWSFLFNLIMFGFASGGSVFVSQFWGAKNMRGIRQTYGMLLMSTLLISLVFTLPALVAPRFILSLFTPDQAVIAEGAMYLSIVAMGFVFSSVSVAGTTLLRSTESVKLPMYTGMAGVATNAALNYILIFGKLGLPAMGLKGAAIATFISMAVNPLLLFAVSAYKRNLLMAPLRQLLAPEKGFAGRFFRVSTPVVLNESLWALGTVGYNMIMGRLGTGNYSALSIERTLESIAFVFFAGLCHACTVIVGKSVGAHDLERAKTDARRFVIIVPAFSLLTGLIIIALRTPLVSLFNVSPEVRATAMTLILIYGLEAFGRFIPYITIVGVFRAGGDTRTGLIYDVACVWLIALPLCAIAAFVLKLPFVAVFAIMLISEDGVKSLLCLKYFFTYKWIQPVTRKDEIAAASEETA